MNINELRYIVAVAQTRNFRRAAEKCFVSQPALSTAVQKLEDELGLRIFERSRTEVSITPNGERIVSQAALILEEVDRLRLMARQGADPLMGPLRLGVIHTVGPYLLPDLIAQLHRSAPEMPLQVEENTTARLEEELRQGALDVAIVALPLAASGLTTRPLYSEPFEVVVPKNHRWAGRASISSAELGEEQVLLLPSVHCFSTQVVETCPELGVKHALVQQGNSLETLRNMVASGMGITVLPATANSSKYRSPLLEIIPFESPVPSRQIGMAWRKSFSRIAALDAIAAGVRHLKLRGLVPVPLKRDAGTA
ncbi:MAG: LysR family transcriptional regulator [Betaproteobacteria bacterium]|nr:LysR family transcriptional regulator [Betaproteobacteria bacterium]